MTVRELVEKLSNLQDQDAEVLAYDADEQKFVPVTGMIYGGLDKIVELCTDDVGDDSVDWRL